MNYQKLYDSIISNAKSLEESRKLQKKQKTNYFERHHITPKCLGGSNDKENLVFLTAKEHFICHKILCEIFPNSYQLKHAFWAMCNKQHSKKQGQLRNYTVSASEYERAKINFGKAHSEYLKNNPTPISNETREKMSANRMGSKNSFYGKKHSEETKLKISRANSGKVRTLEQRIHNGNMQRGKAHSEESKRRISDSKRGIPRPRKHCEFCATDVDILNYTKYHGNMCKLSPNYTPITYTCPHCNLIGSYKHNMHKYHFDNCKFKK